MHVHIFGNLSNACMAAGSHFDPHPETHGGRVGKHRHGGDLGNIEADAQGKALFEFVQMGLKLYGKHGIVGRSIVIHVTKMTWASTRKACSKPSTDVCMFFFGSPKSVP